jgi:uncharacterized membrane protein (DUF4010 family)
LPLLPTGPFLGAIALKPRALWTVVLLFSGLNFAGFIARRIVGPSRGLGITGALGGVISSTAVRRVGHADEHDRARVAPVRRTW